MAQSQPQALRCDGATLEVRGSAELKRAADRLRFSLELQSEAAGNDAALAQLQTRLAAVRTALQALQVSELEVTSPTTWSRPATKQKPAAIQARLQVSGELAPARLQALIRQVGGLPGVQLAPVSTQPSVGGDAAARRQLLKGAYQDALTQARDLADAIGLRTVTPLSVVLEGGMRPLLMRTVASESVGFDPAELPGPVDRLALQATFCAR
ncbi:SIMPL domain-containing protein [Synechococcus sp. ATX 2A4]|nr:SIMPL domain-containing protein [Synechococcus sp. ATX 2A4]